MLRNDVLERAFRCFSAAWCGARGCAVRAQFHGARVVRPCAPRVAALKRRNARFTASPCSVLNVA
eukprot:4999255-Lingulodinium_polyedra.AAC.1